MYTIVLNADDPKIQAALSKQVAIVVKDSAEGIDAIVSTLESAPHTFSAEVPHILLVKKGDDATVVFAASKKLKVDAVYELPISAKFTTLLEQTRAQKQKLPTQSHKSVLVTSAKSGSGKSLIAVNLAHQFAKQGQTLLLDEGVPSLSAQLLTQTNPQYSLETIAPILNSSISGSRIKGAVTTTKFGFDILPSKIFPAHYPLLSASAQTHLLRGAAESYAQTVVDFYTPLTLSEYEIALSADVVLMVMTPEAANIRATFELLQELRKSHSRDLQRILFVLNRLDRKKQPKLKAEIEKELGISIVGCIEEDAETVAYYAERACPISDETLVVHDDLEKLAQALVV